MTSAIDAELGLYHDAAHRRVHRVTPLLIYWLAHRCPRESQRRDIIIRPEMATQRSLKVAQRRAVDAAWPVFHIGPDFHLILV